jgi:hypothetical protein
MLDQYIFDHALEVQFDVRVPESWLVEKVGDAPSNRGMEFGQIISYGSPQKGRVAEGGVAALREKESAKSTLLGQI